MSYILDALRRADAERQRGGVPGLHAPVLPGPAPAADGEPPSGHRGGLLAGAALVLVAGLGAGWYVGRPPPAAVPQGGVAPASAASAAAPSQDPTPGLAPAVRAPPPLPAAVMAQAAASQAAPLAMPVATPQPAPRDASAAALARPSRPETAPQPLTVTPEARLSTWAELPDALRREMPALSLGGAMHAEQAELRVAIVNGQVFHEGDAVAPGLTVRSIRPKAVVFDFRGQRFEMPL